MTVIAKVQFWLLKFLRLAIYSIKFRVDKWIVIEGIRFPVYLSYGYSMLRFLNSGQYESGEIHIIKETIEKNDVVLELGTGLGFISAFCSKQTGSANVHTFEANPMLEKKIKELYTKNGVNPNLEFAILAKEEGVTHFYVDKANLLASSLIQTPGPGHHKISVKRKDLNKEIRQIKPTYLIMDIEGAEHDIFKSINFHSIKKVQFELHPDKLTEVQVKEIFEVLAQNSFLGNQKLRQNNNFYFYKDTGA